MMNIQDRLRRRREHTISTGGSIIVPVNPDGPMAANYIDNTLTHMGHILKIAFDNIQDDEIRNELRRRAYAALRGTP